MPFFHCPYTLIDLAKLHSPGHEPMEEMRSHLHFVATLKQGARIGRIPNVNRLQYVCLRLLRRAGNISPSQVATLNRIEGVVRHHRAINR